MKPKVADPFYSSTAWLKVRAAVLKRDGYCCVWCGRSVRGKGRARVDHIKPRREFPQLSLVMTNLRTLCCDCDAIRHREKGGGDPEVGCDVRGRPISPQHHWNTGGSGHARVPALPGPGGVRNPAAPGAAMPGRVRSERIGGDVYAPASMPTQLQRHGVRRNRSG